MEGMAEPRTTSPLARAINFALAVLLAATALFWLFVLYRTISGASNHVGWNIGRVSYFFAACAALALFGAAAWRGRWAVGCAIGFLLSLGGAYALDTYNVIVPYEEWLKRGMPERGHLSRGEGSVSASDGH